MSPLTLRFVVGAVGTAAVGALLVTVLIVRRRKRARAQEAVPQAAPTEKRPRQPGLLQTLVVSVFASVISGVLLFFITPLFAPDSSDTAPRADIPQVATDDSAIDGREHPLDLDLVPEGPALEELEESIAPPAMEPTPPEPIEPEDDEEPAQVIEPTTPEADVLVTDATAKWEALLHPPTKFGEIVPSDNRLRISGAATSTIMQISGPDSRLSPEILEPRILFGQVGVSQILYPITPASEEMKLDPRPFIEGACAVNLLRPSAPPSPGPPMQAARLLVENARTTVLLEMEVPALDGGNE